VGRGRHPAGDPRLLLGGAAQLIEIRPLEDADRALAIDRWGPGVARCGELIQIEGLPGFAAWIDGARAGC
jgi:hypothetical protein